MSTSSTAPPPPPLGDAVLLEVERYPIHSRTYGLLGSTNPVTSTGSIDMGWAIDSDTAQPGEESDNDHIQVQIVGENKSPARVEELRLQWVETVTWSMSTTSSSSSSSPSKRRRRPRRETVQRVVGEEIIPITEEEHPWWQPFSTSSFVMSTSHSKDVHPALSALKKPDHCYYHRFAKVKKGGKFLGRLDADLQQGTKNVLQPLEAHILTTSHLRLARDTRESYTGKWLQVRHSLVVTVKTKGYGSSMDSETYSLTHSKLAGESV